MSGRIYELPAHPGPFPWTHIVPSDSEAAGSFGFSHQKLAENYTGDSRVLGSVTALTGGSNALDGIATADGATVTGAVREVMLGRTVYRYQLVNGADVETVPDVIRPDDYDAGSNNRVWRLLRTSAAVQLNSIPGVNLISSVPLTGVTLGAETWTLWARVFVGPRALYLRLLPTTGANNRVSLDVASSTSGGAMTLTLNDGSGASLATVSVADFRARYAGSLVDLILVRRATATPGTHEIAVYANGDRLGAITFSSSATVASAKVDASVNTEGVMVRFALFRNGLADPDIYALMQNGIGAADRWGRFAVTYQSDFSAGIDGWGVNGGGTLVGNIDGVGVPSQDNVLRLTVNSATTSEQVVSKIVTTLASRRVRVQAKVWLPTSNAGADQVEFVWFGTTSIPAIVLTGKTTGWVDVDFESVAPSTAIAGLRLGFSAGSGTHAVGDLFYVASFTLTQLGAVFDLNCGVGAGRFLPDNSPNGFNGELTSHSSQHTRPLTSGQLTLVKTFDHDAISATAGTTVLGYLPSNAAVMRVEFERLAAFDSAVTLDLGITGTPGRYVSGQAVDATGNVLVTSAVQTTESPTAQTTLYIKKSGATTVGSVRVKLVYEIRGNSAADA